LSASPFPPDRRLGLRRARRLAALQDEFVDRLAAAQRAGGLDPVHPRAVIPAAVAAELVHELDLEGVEEAMLLAIAPARGLSWAPVSGYHVGAVGLAAASGDLVMGGNLELPGASIWQTVHGEGSVTLLALARGERLASLAITQARPCAHCRQVLAEVDGAHGGDGERGGLRLLDLDGRLLRLADIYPWPFGPGDLGMRGIVPGIEPWPDLDLADLALPPAIRETLLAAGRRAHAPYSGAPAAVALATRDGNVSGGAVLESVAFNPTIGPMQDALVGLLASDHGDLDGIERAWLALGRDAPVGHEAMARDALAAAAPGAPLLVTYWS
jgi:cytidine deaminase